MWNFCLQEHIETVKVISKSILQIIFFSILLIPIWGLGFLSAQTANLITAICSLGLTVLIFFLFREKKHALFLFVGPVFYALVSLFAMVAKNNFDIADPIFVLFAISISLYLLRTKPLAVQAVPVLLGFVYIFMNYSLPEKFEPEPKPEPISREKNLDQIRLINHEKDTLQFQDLKFPLLIETWNETCMPCRLSLKHLQPELDKIDINKIYLYQARNGFAMETNKVFQFKSIKHKEEIMIDLNNNLFDTLELPSYPYFLIFDKNQQLTFDKSGYHPDFHKEILEELNSEIKKVLQE